MIVSRDVVVGCQVKSRAKNGAVRINQFGTVPVWPD